MRRLMAFSYKGGAGRSTALANIAAALAKKGQRVLVIDYDMQAPGLHVIFKAVPGVTRFDGRTAGDGATVPLGLSDYLLGDDPPSLALEKYVVNLAEACDHEGTRDLLAGFDGSLHFLSGVSASPGEAFDPHRSGERLFQLVDHLETTAAFDYVCIDSPSGINERSEDVFDVSQLVLIFYRWSMQHVEGTEAVMSYLNEYISDGELGARTYEIIGNAVPSNKSLQLEAVESDADVLIAYKQQVQDRLAKLLMEQYAIEGSHYESTAFGEHRRRQLEELVAAKDGDQPLRLRYVIDETPMMKLKEYLAVLHSDDTAYEEIASDLVENRILLPRDRDEPEE